MWYHKLLYCHSCGGRGSRTCGTSSAAVELKRRYLVLYCQDGLKWSEFHIVHYFQNPFILQSQQIARLTVGCLLAQDLVVGASRDLQRQKLRFPFCCSSLTPFLLPCQGLCLGLACGQQEQGCHGIAGTGTLQAGMARGSRGAQPGLQPCQLLPDVFWMLLLLPLQPSVDIWYIRDLKSECIYRCFHFFLSSSFSESTYGAV